MLFFLNNKRPIKISCYLSYVCLVTLPLISNSTIWFTIGSMEVWLHFNDYIDLTWDLFRRPTFGRFVTLMSHLCHQSVLCTVLQYFYPVFQQKSILEENLLRLNRHCTLWKNSRRCYSCHY